jgi:predicted enzyme related to lactoylglutathione lyase
MGNPGNDHRIDNIEFAVSDVARSREFYGKAFGWTFTDYGPTYCEFSDGRLTGGLTQSGHPHGPAAQRSTCLSYGGIFHVPVRIDGSLSFGQYIRNISMKLPEGAGRSTQWASDVRMSRCQIRTRTLAVA